MIDGVPLICENSTNFNGGTGHYMESLGIMLYGYGREHAEKVRHALGEILGRDVTLISASGREDDIVEDILETEEALVFEEKETRVLVFLGFSREELSSAIDRFPRESGIIKPIFCGLTESNCRWKLDYLLEHLREEHARWTGKKDGAGDGPSA